MIELSNLTEDDFKTCFKQFKKAWEECVAAGENYFGGDTFTNL